MTRYAEMIQKIPRIESKFRDVPHFFRRFRTVAADLILPSVKCATVDPYSENDFAVCSERLERCARIVCAISPTV